MFASNRYFAAAMLLASTACGATDRPSQKASEQASQEGALHAEALAAQGQTYEVVGGSSGLALDVVNEQSINGARIQQWPYWGGANQQWTLSPQGNGTYEVVNVNSGRCLEVMGGSSADGAVVDQWDCWAGTNQLWTLQPIAGSSLVSLVNALTGKCLDVLDARTDQGAPVQQWTCWGGENQSWQLTEINAQPAPIPTPTPTPVPTAGAVKPTAEQDALIRQYMKTVLDTPHAYPGGGQRGSPGAYEAIGEANIEEFVASITDNAARYLPSSLAFNEKVALLIADINAESSFQVGTSAPNGAGSSVGVQQVTGYIWVPMFQNHASGDGLYYYNGAPWAPSSTTLDQVATSIWDNMHVANWAISVQAQNGGQDANVGPGGPMARTWWTGLYCWVSGYPAAQAGGDVAQSSNYRKEQQADLSLLGLDPALLDTTY